MSTYKEEQQGSHTASHMLHTALFWLAMTILSPHVPSCKQDWMTPQVTVPSRDTKFLILKNMKRKKRGGEAIWKPDLDIDTWSDAGQTK